MPSFGLVGCRADLVALPPQEDRRQHPSGPAAVLLYEMLEGTAGSLKAPAGDNAGHAAPLLHGVSRRAGMEAGHLALSVMSIDESMS